VAQETTPEEPFVSEAGSKLYSAILLSSKYFSKCLLKLKVSLGLKREGDFTMNEFNIWPLFQFGRPALADNGRLISLVQEKVAFFFQSIVDEGL